MNAWERDDDEELSRQREEEAQQQREAAEGVDDADTNAADGDGEGATGKKKEGATVRRKRNVLSEEHLLSQEGFKKIYQTFPFQVCGSAAGQEVNRPTTTATVSML